MNQTKVIPLGERLMARALRREQNAQRKLLKALARHKQRKAYRWQAELMRRTLRVGMLKRLYGH